LGVLPSYIIRNQQPHTPRPRLRIELRRGTVKQLEQSKLLKSRQNINRFLILKESVVPMM